MTTMRVPKAAHEVPGTTSGRSVAGSKWNVVDAPDVRLADTGDGPATVFRWFSHPVTAPSPKKANTKPYL